MLKKLLASIGVGAAKVDTILDNDILYPGAEFSGEIKIYGGDVVQDISGLKVAVMTQAEVETSNGEYHANILLTHWYMKDSFSVAPRETISIPFAGELPLEIPITENGAQNNKTKVWLQTGLEIDLALDANDQDCLYIQPTPLIKAFLDAMRMCGFELYSADVEKGFLHANTFSSSSGVYQELEFKPSQMSNFTYNEIEVSFVVQERQTHIMLEIDKKFNSDKLTTFTLQNDQADMNAITAQLKRFL